MKEYIEREALDDFKNEVVGRFIALCFGNDYNKLSLLTIGNNIDEIYEKYQTRPAADVAEVRHGEWVCVNDTDNVWMCDGADGCGGEIILLEGTPLDNEWERCPYCGARMDGKGEDE